MLGSKLIRTLIVALALGALGIAARAQFTGYYTFNSWYDGFNPYYADYLAQGIDGNIHGTVPQGSGYAFYGSTLDYPLGGAVKTHGLTLTTQPENPWGGLTLGIDGNLYGASVHGGNPVAPGSMATFGTVFMMSNGQPTTLYKFTGGANGSYPYSPPIQAPDGNLYGVTYESAFTGYVYQLVKSNGAWTIGWIHPLPGGSYSALIMANDGNLYGTTAYGGLPINGVSPSNNNGGEIFRVTLGGVISGVFNFDASSTLPNGIRPYGAVMQGADGYLYGATSAGGTYSGGTLYKVSLSGTNFSVIHHFQFNDGTAPTGGLVQDANGYIYGLTTAGGWILNIIVPGQGTLFTTGGTIFKTDTTGVNFTRLFTFYKNKQTSQGSGMSPYATPILHTSGTMYGLTYQGGSGPTSNCTYGCYDNGGEFFSYNAGSPPFINVVVQRSAKVGDKISIIGQGFLNFSSISFNGTLAPKFTYWVLSDNFMQVVVPPGATTGKIVVQELNGETQTTLATPYNFTIACSLKLCLPHL